MAPEVKKKKSKEPVKEVDTLPVNPIPRYIPLDVSEPRLGLDDANLLRRVEAMKIKLASDIVLSAVNSAMTDVSLASCDLSMIPSDIFLLPGMDSLDLSKNKLTSETLESLVPLSNLRILNVSTNLLAGSFPEILTTISKKLEELCFDDNILTSLPDYIENLRSIVWLSLQRNQLQYISPKIGALQSMMYLNLSGNQITVLPDEIGELTSLVELILSKNKLTSLPESIGKLSSLESLIVDSNDLKLIPDSLSKCSNLAVINLMCNSLKSLPDNLFAEMPKLEEAFLSSNKLSSLPSSICQCSQLRVLVASSNVIASLPENIGNLTNLRTIILSENEKLASLPASVSRWKNLEQGHFRNCKLKTIPGNIPIDWSKLNYLDVKGKKKNTCKLPNTLEAVLKGKTEGVAWSKPPKAKKKA